ncbi:MAG: hypothetical protein K2P31_00145 [Rickettsiaceae bacterium]|nr:hypothetical protein [Rickettsiaceae bacterium]
MNLEKNINEEGVQVEDKNKINLKRNKNVQSVFHKNKDFEVSVMFSAFVCLGIWITSSPRVEIGILMAMLVPVSLVFYIAHRSIGYKRYQNNHEYIESKFEGSLDELATNLVKIGLELKSKIGNQYMFQTRYYFLFNSRVVVRDHGEHCTLLLKRISFNYLNDFIVMSLIRRTT